LSTPISEADDDGDLEMLDEVVVQVQSTDLGQINGHVEESASSSDDDLEDMMPLGNTWLPRCVCGDVIDSENPRDIATCSNPVSKNPGTFRSLDPGTPWLRHPSSSLDPVEIMLTIHRTAVSRISMHAVSMLPGARWNGGVTNVVQTSRVGEE
jgi:hypothetical protein